MRRRLLVCGLLITAVMVHSTASTAGRQEGADATTRTPRNQAEFDEMFQQVSNWGRWGKDDSLGTLNLITDAKRAQAAGLVKSGVAVSLAHTYVTEQAAGQP